MSTPETDDWPKHPDGSKMTMGEMPKEDRRRLWKAAVDRFKAKLDGSLPHKMTCEIIERADPDRMSS